MSPSSPLASSPPLVAAPALASDAAAAPPAPSPAITVDSPAVPDPAQHALAKAMGGRLPTTPARRSSSRGTVRARSRSPAPATTQSLSALHSPAPQAPLLPRTSPTAAAASPAPLSLSRPAPVVPPSPSVPPTPSYSRPTSPRPPPRSAGDEPASPTRPKTHEGGLLLSSGAGPAEQAGGLSHSGSQVDLSHIFERDVEFASSHHITPSEAVDVAVPPVLTEAALALSAADDDPIASRDLSALVLEAEFDAQAGSGWSSPVVAPASSLHHASPPQLQQPSQSQSQHPLSNVYANASRSPTRDTRSFSPDSGSGGRAASPGSSTTFSVGTPPTSAGGGSPPPLLPPGSAAQPSQAAPFSLGPFGKRLAEALENEANKLPPGLVGGLGAPLLSPGSSAKSDASEPAAPASPPSAGGSGSSKAASYAPLKPSLLLPFPPTASPSLSLAPGLGSSSATDDPFSSPLASPSAELGPSPLAASTPHHHHASAAAAALAAPHPRKLSFASYADLVNEERLAEITGERLAEGGTSTPAPGGPGGAGGTSPTQVRSRSGTKTGAQALGLGVAVGAGQPAAVVEQLEGKLAAATLEA
ncbi:uncharacterized protein JCM10292_006299 [Rhodotorula paludigena]|uniref:uncharacterized protein n=1 Tax=Rhodotorula paludigena TaxID=86838 RepID=UPI00317277E1